MMWCRFLKLLILGCMLLQVACYHNGRKQEAVTPPTSPTEPSAKADPYIHGYPVSIDEKRGVYTYKFLLCDGKTPIGELTIPMQEIKKGGKLTAVAALPATFTRKKKFENLHMSFTVFNPFIYSNGACRGDVILVLNVPPQGERGGTIRHIFGLVYEKGQNGVMLMIPASDNVPFLISEHALCGKARSLSKELSLQFRSL